ncbi:MAG: dipicolinate synthase subunit B [Clostridia bacterium]|nr:dipicolinate synthase subunit B [Clostridia bacterium]MBQ5597361.1 dipicolinate synthase subunit B [Clostridia bacterium]
MINLKVGYAMCGSFCTLKRAVEEIKVLKEKDFDIYPIMSPITYSTDTRFGKAADFISEVEEICGKKIICTVKDAEPIGPKGLLDVLVISPCTGNTLGKIANGITDSSVSMAAKAHLRNGRPLVLTIATNDALSASAKNIGSLMNTKNVYFVPFGQDDAFKKPTSLISDFSLIYDTVISALDGKQLQPILLK